MITKEIAAPIENHLRYRNLHFAHDGRKLEADEDEDHAVQQIIQQLPDTIALQTAFRTKRLPRAMTDIQACRNDGEHAGKSEPLRRQIGNVRRKDGERYLNSRIS